MAQPNVVTEVPRNTIRQGHSLDLLRQLPDGCVQTIITSPPYFGLRSYKTSPQVWEGVSTCQHAWGAMQRAPWANELPGPVGRAKNTIGSRTRSAEAGAFCQHCDAWRGELGSEPTPALFVAHLALIFRACWRVLRDDGTLWLNIGDSYTGSGRGPADAQSKIANTTQRQGFDSPVKATYGLPPKSLLGIPWRVAFALQDDGWTLRSDIIWEKENCMPESVLDRPTTNYEHIFLFAKQPRYYYDQHAIAEPTKTGAKGSTFTNGKTGQRHARQGESTYTWDATRNARAVWTISTEAFGGNHFATFPTELVRRCIAAGSSPSACEHCGAPYKRVISKGAPAPEPAHRAPTKRLEPGQSGHAANGNMGFRASKLSGQEQTRWRTAHPDTQTGWAPTCRCPNSTGSGRSLVLDPFSGAATVALVARRLGRDYLGMELNAAYIALGDERLQRDLLPPAMKHTALALIPATLWDDPPG